MTDAEPPKEIRFEGAPRAPIPPMTGKGLGETALRDLTFSAGHFYGVDDVSVVKGPGGISVTARKTNQDGSHERFRIGEGHEIDRTVERCLEGMRSLEKINARTGVFIEMTPKVNIGFTALEHYAPKVAPGSETYPVPSYLDVLLEDPFNGGHTYQNTVRQDGWQRELRSVVNEFTENNPDGQRLLETLKIRSLSHLTPEQAVKLSAAFVQSVSKYSSEDVGVKELTPADRSTTIELLREGMANRGNKAWKGNGICRNVAANVKAVFEALKATQTDLSMLANTYAVFDAGLGGQGYSDKRPNPYKIDRSGNSRSGHAWNSFITVGKDGSAEATIIDATWALEQDPDSALEHLDRTEVRAVGLFFKLFERSEVKDKALIALTFFVEGSINKSFRNRQLSKTGRESMEQYIVTSYLKAAEGYEELLEGIGFPASIVGAATRMAGKLEKHEVETLFALDQASGGFERERLKSILSRYDGKRVVKLSPEWSAKSLLFEDSELQKLAFEAVGEERLAELVGYSGKFRAKVRELNPGILPEFDPQKRREDADELMELVSPFASFHSKEPGAVIKRMRAIILDLAGEDSLYQAIVAGRSDYDLAKNFGVILGHLRTKTV